jgi:hypothetical protein
MVWLKVFGFGSVRAFIFPGFFFSMAFGMSFYRAMEII